MQTRKHRIFKKRTVKKHHRIHRIKSIVDKHSLERELIKHIHL